MVIGVDFKCFFYVCGYKDIKVLRIGGDFVDWFVFVLKFFYDDFDLCVIVINDFRDFFVFDILIVWCGYFYVVG